MRQKKITSTQIAKIAGVSQSVVSRVFTPGKSVSPKTAEKVRKIAQEYGYRPNILARSLITGKSRIIGLIVAYLNNQFYPESLERLSNLLQEKGYHLLIFTVDNKPEQVERTLNDLLDYQVDGIIVASVSLDSDIVRKCKNANVPIVLYNRSQDDEEVSSVTSDNIIGGQKIAHHFADVGVKKPAYLAGWEEASTQRDREEGFLLGLKEKGLKLHKRALGNFDFECSQKSTYEMFKHDPPDALFAANDHMAFAAMDIIRYKLGLKIPQDVIVAGYDDVQLTSWPSFDLTSVRQAANRMCEATVKIMISKIEQSSNSVIHQRIEGPLIIRGSTKR